MVAEPSRLRTTRSWLSCLLAVAAVGCTAPQRSLPSTWTPFEPVVPAPALGESDLGNEPDTVPAAPSVEAPAGAPVEATPPLVHEILPAAEPCTLTIEVGQQLVFINQDAICHSLFSSSAANEFTTGLLQPRDRAGVHFANPGTVQVYCSLHDHRQLTIHVLPKPTAR